jgi:20S proteasome alpha/beta subunit
MFDIFTRCTVGDVIIERDTPEHYTLKNLLLNVSKSIKRFNELGRSPFKVLMVSHLEKPLELYHIDANGKSNKVESGYKAIGSGKHIADMFCRALEFEKISMKEFIKHAYLAIGYLIEYCPELGVGVEPERSPDIKYLYYDLREQAASDEDKEEYKNSTNKEKLEQKRQALQKIAKE